MNTTSSSSGAFPEGPIGGQTVGGFGYGVGVSLALIVVLGVITYISYVCNRARSSDGQSRRYYFNRRVAETSASSASDDGGGGGSPANNIVVKGLDEATILNYPKLVYSQIRDHKSDSSASGCSICLADYKDTDLLRLLPGCGHLFHLNCIDPWLRLQPTCPVCRTTPFPSSLDAAAAAAAPVAVALPLAAAS